MDAANVAAVDSRRPPPLVPRVTAAVFIVLSVLAFVFSLAALGAVWAIRAAAAQSVDDLAVSAGQRLQAGQTDLETLSQSVAQVQGVVGLADDQVKAAATRTDQAGAVLTALQTLIDGSLGDSVDNLARRAARLRDVVAALDSAVATLSQMPVVGRLACGVLAQADAALASLQDAQMQVGDLRQEVRGARDASGGVLPTAMNSLDSSLTSLQGKLAAAQTRLASIKQDLQSMQSSLPEARSRLTAWLTYAAIALSVMLLGTSIAMISVFVQALSFFRGRDVLARWRHR